MLAMCISLFATSAVANDDRVLASYDGIRVTVADVEAELQRFGAQQREIFGQSATSRTNLVREILLRRVLAEMARAEGMDTQPHHQRRVQLMEERLLYENFMAAREAEVINDERVEALARDEYRVNRERFVLPDEIRASHILIAVNDSRDEAAARELAGLLRARVLAGQSFEDLAREYSDDSGSGARGGDLGFFGRGRMVAPFEQAAFALDKPGDVAEVVLTQFGFHVIRLDERREAGLRAFETVREVLMEEVRTRMRRQVRLGVVSPISDSAAFQVDADALDAAFSNLR